MGARPIAPSRCVTRDVSKEHTCGGWAWRADDDNDDDDDDDDESLPRCVSSLGRRWKARGVILPVGADIRGKRCDRVID